jgi:hypothetical protein
MVNIFKKVICLFKKHDIVLVSAHWVFEILVIDKCFCSRCGKDFFNVEVHEDDIKGHKILL